MPKPEPMPAPDMSAPSALIRLRSGALFDLADPRVDGFTLDDIAGGLAKLCRFTGQTRRFYSVAQHSVLCAMLVPPELAKEALLHDAHEALIGDVASPLKALLPDYRRIEARVEAVVRNRFAVPRELHPLVKQADAIMLRIEQVALMGEPPGGIAPIHESLLERIAAGTQGPDDAEAFFRSAYDAVLGGGSPA